MVYLLAFTDRGQERICSIANPVSPEGDLVTLKAICSGSKTSYIFVIKQGNNRPK
jgi:ribosomal protein L7Ae-like RNA K-turn-binding protein